jgi:hypothetical protein
MIFHYRDCVWAGNVCLAIEVDVCVTYIDIHW